MITRLGMAPRREGIDFEQFQRHWRTSHADVVSGLPGLRSYDQFHAVLEQGSPVLPYPGFDACSALRFDSLAEMDAAFDSPTFHGAVRSDENEFVDKSRFRGVVGRWRPAVEGDMLGSLGGVVLMRLWRASEDDADAGSRLAASLEDRLPARAAGLLVADPAAHEGRFPVSADVVEATGHPTVEQARAHLAARAGDDPAGRLIGLHLARVVNVPVGAARNDSTEQRTRA